MSENADLLKTRLDNIMSLNKEHIEKASLLTKMMHHNVIAAKAYHVMHLCNSYNYPFISVVSGFIRLYNGENTKFTRTTIAHVSQIDEDKFQLVRRAENCVTSSPLYERIIIDRKAQRLSGFTFENSTDE